MGLGFGLLAEGTPPELPSVVDVGPLITAGITSLAGVVVIAVAGYVAFMVVRKGLRWLNVALR